MSGDYQATEDFLADRADLDGFSDTILQEFRGMIGPVIAEQKVKPYRLDVVIASLETAKQSFMSLCTAITEAQTTLETLKGEPANV